MSVYPCMSRTSVRRGLRGSDLDRPLIMVSSSSAFLGCMARGTGRCFSSLFPIKHRSHPYFALPGPPGLYKTIQLPALSKFLPDNAEPVVVQPSARKLPQRCSASAAANSTSSPSADSSSILLISGPPIPAITTTSHSDSA